MMSFSLLMFVPYIPLVVTITSEFWNILAKDLLLAGLITSKILLSKVDTRLADYSK